MRIKIHGVFPCTAGYSGWLISYEPDANSRWLLVPTAGDSPELIWIESNFHA